MARFAARGALPAAPGRCRAKSFPDQLLRICARMRNSTFEAVWFRPRDPDSLQQKLRRPALGPALPPSPLAADVGVSAMSSPGRHLAPSPFPFSSLFMARAIPRPPEKKAQGGIYSTKNVIRPPMKEERTVGKTSRTAHPEQRDLKFHGGETGGTMQMRRLLFFDPGSRRFFHP